MFFNFFTIKWPDMMWLLVQMCTNVINQRQTLQYDAGLNNPSYRKSNSLSFNDKFLLLATEKDASSPCSRQTSALGFDNVVSKAESELCKRDCINESQRSQRPEWPPTHASGVSSSLKEILEENTRSRPIPVQVQKERKQKPKLLIVRLCFFQQHMLFFVIPVPVNLNYIKWILLLWQIFLDQFNFACIFYIENSRAILPSWR